MDQPDPQFEPAITKKLLSYIEIGVPPEDACQAVNVSEATFRRWMSEGKKGTPRYAEFWDDLDKALQKSQVVAVKVLQKSMNTDWRCALAFLERRFPETWGKRTRSEVVHSGTATQKIDVDVKGMTREQLAQLLSDPATREQITAPAGSKPKLRAIAGGKSDE